MRCSYHIEQSLSQSSAEMISSLAYPLSPTTDATNHYLSEFLCCLDPAIEAHQWLFAHHMDEVLINWHSLTTFISDSAVAGQVSVDLQKLIVTLPLCKSEFGFIEAVESVYNDLGQMATTPLIADFDASCCILPYHDDFTTYSESMVKIKDLFGINMVGGEGLIESKVLDMFGHKCIITIKGYHVPIASVCFCLQCIFQTFRGRQGTQDGETYAKRLMESSVLEAPYGSPNLPSLKIHNLSQPTCFWMNCISFNNVTDGLWKNNFMAATNQNLTAAQKKLLQWHQHLSHTRLSTVHNL